jgi:DNA primase
VGPRTFTLRTMIERVADVGDIWSDLHEHATSLREPLARLRELAGT